MDIHELSSLPEKITEVEELLEKYPSCYFNLANTKKPLMTCELSEIAFLGDRIKGLNILLETADDYDSENLWPFMELEYLKLSFTENDVYFENFSNFQNWLMNITSLKVIYFPEIEESTEFTSFIIHSLSADKPYPLIVIYKAKRKLLKHLNDNTDSVYVPGNRKIYQVSKRKEVELTQEGVQEIIKKEKLISSAPAKELFFSGHLEVEDGDWLLNADGLFFEENKEIVVSFSGSDDLGNFNCKCRCNWQPDEGGFYFASRVSIEYANYASDSDFYMSIKFSEVKITDSSTCYVKGVWLQSNEQWVIEGELSKNKFKTIFKDNEK